MRGEFWRWSRNPVPVPGPDPGPSWCLLQVVRGLSEGLPEISHYFIPTRCAERFKELHEETRGEEWPGIDDEADNDVRRPVIKQNADDDYSMGYFPASMYHYDAFAGIEEIGEALNVPGCAGIRSVKLNYVVRFCAQARVTSTLRIVNLTEPDHTDSFLA